MGGFFLLMGPIWPSRQVSEERGLWVTVKSKRNPLFDFPTCHLCQELASPKAMSWDPKALEGSTCSFSSKKGWESGGRTNSQINSYHWLPPSTQEWASSFSSSLSSSSSSSSFSLSLHHHHDHHVFPRASRVRHCARWFTCTVSFSSHSHTQLHIGN